MSLVVIATTTFYPLLGDVRAELAVQTLTEIISLGLSVVVVDGGSPDEVTDQFKKLDAIVLTENPSSSMGASRRQAMAFAGELAGDDGVVVWMEPEKLDFVSQIAKTVRPLLAGKADMVIPRRLHMDSYPPEQAAAENIGNLAVSYLLGQEFDFWFGPMAMNQRALQEVLQYDGDYGDKWDSIMIPRLRAIAAGLRVVSEWVNYTHPAQQTFAETGNLDWLMRRVDQLKNIVPALTEEAEKLGLYPR